MFDELFWLIEIGFEAVVINVRFTCAVCGLRCLRMEMIVCMCSLPVVSKSGQGPQYFLLVGMTLICSRHDLTGISTGGQDPQWLSRHDS